MIKNVQFTIDKLGKREDIISNDEIVSEFKKVYSTELAARLKQTAEEMGQEGMFEKLFSSPEN